MGEQVPGAGRADWEPSLGGYQWDRDLVPHSELKGVAIRDVQAAYNLEVSSFVSPNCLAPPGPGDGPRCCLALSPMSWLPIGPEATCLLLLSSNFLPFTSTSDLASHCMPPAEFWGLGLSTVGRSSLLFSQEAGGFCQDLVPALSQGSLAGFRQSLLAVGLVGACPVCAEGLTFVKNLSYARWFTCALSFDVHSKLMRK